eukprot:353395-Chlamydomonas_euryale.AAC.5
MSPHFTHARPPTHAPHSAVTLEARLVAARRARAALSIQRAYRRWRTWLLTQRLACASESAAALEAAAAARRAAAAAAARSASARHGQALVQVRRHNAVQMRYKRGTTAGPVCQGWAGRRDESVWEFRCAVWLCDAPMRRVAV